jgi:serine-type D-Ala-D-Ala carboxypeptidase/endopeptidase (penicillin-binding protein 4)
LKFNLYIFFLILIPASPVFSDEPENLEYARLNTAVKKVAEDKALSHGFFGFCAMDVKTGKIIAQHNSDQSLIPASTMKAVTTATSLLIWGGKHRFSTRIEYDGYIDSDCVLHGNIYIKGGGDPTLGSLFFNDEKERFNFLKDWTKAVFEAGITKINGSVIADDKIFNGEWIPSGWSWGDIGNYYGAGAAGLSIFDNIFEIEFSTRGAGEKASIKKIKPGIPYMVLINEVYAAQTSSDNSFLYGAPASFERIIRGTIPAGASSFKVKGAIPDPPLLAASAFDEVMKFYGIEISGNPSTVSRTENQNWIKNKRQLLDEFHSPYLDSIVYWTNMKSINSYAENMINHIGLYKNKIGDTQAGTRAVTEYWKSNGIDTNGLFIADGSGLSRSNGITARQLTGIMKYMAGTAQFEPFYNSLPVAGRTGSLASLCRGTPAENNLRAKSGYINRVRAYTGYVTDKKGNMIAFSMIANNFTCQPSEMKGKLEKIMVAMAE